MNRRAFAVSLLAALVAALAAPSPGAAAPPEVPDQLRAFSVIPPGQDGTVGAGLVTGPHFADQLDMYAALIDDDDVTEEELSSYFHSAQFGPGATVEREYSPRAGVTVFRDALGLPHIYADTDAGAAFALGYVAAEDRLWHMDVLRHAGKGRLTEILGRDFLDTDKQTRRSGYTVEELSSMIAAFDDRFGEEGAALQAELTEYANGVNARIDEVLADPALLPVEYAFPPPGITPEPWTPADTAAIVILQLRSFGTTSLAELANAALWKSLRARLGKKLGAGVFRDLLSLDAPNVYSTIPSSEGTFESVSLGKRDPKARAIPDNAAKLIEGQLRAQSERARLLRGLGLGARSSNFLAVAPSESATGNALEFGAPQVGYSVPQFFIDLDVHSPSFDFRGSAIPGASLLVPIGRGIDYAWSLTSGASDTNDTRVERLCNPGGGKVTKNSNGYKFNGKCKRMESRTETFEIRDDTPAEATFYRTQHGPVIARSTVKGDPVAIVDQPTAWMRELDTVVTFQRINSNEMDSVQEFAAALEPATVSFNAVYVDESDIGYFHLGMYAVQHKGVDVMLPSWGTGGWEWRGFLEYAQHPQMINPAQGFVANWNNRPAAGWNNSDSSTWGPAHRVGLLSTRMESLLAGDGTASLSDVVDVIREAATIDARAEFLGDKLLGYSDGMEGVAGEARGIVADWMAGGAHRMDRDRNQIQDFAPAVAIFDEWFTRLVHRVFDDEIGPGNYDKLIVPISDDASKNNGSSYYADFSNYLWNLFEGQSGYARDYCDDLDTGAKENCRSQARAALQDAVDSLTQEQGPQPAAWTSPADYIEFGEVGAVGVDPIPWQNRGTYNHAVEVLGGR